MSASRDSVQYRAGWNAASRNIELSDNASDEAVDGYHDYFCQYHPQPENVCNTRGFDNKKSKAYREKLKTASYLKIKLEGGIK